MEHMTNLAAALDLDPEIESRIRQIIWMGGALQVSGNLKMSLESGHDGSAEWNAYWDPPAAERVWRTGIRITICPLDTVAVVPRP